MLNTYDVVIIGGGAAGLSAGLILSRARRSVLVVDSGDPRNAPARGIHNYLGREATPPFEFLAIGRKELEQYGAQVRSGTVTSVDRASGSSAESPRFDVELDAGPAVAARRVIVATGLTDELPPIENLAGRWGRDVLHCPFCHGWEVRDQAIGILSTGPLSLHQVLLFGSLTDRLTLFLDDQESPDPEALAALGVSVVPGKVEALRVDDDRLTGVRLAGRTTVPIDALVVAPKFRGRAEMLRPLGLVNEPVEMMGREIGWSIPADEFGTTAVPGVHVAGNVTNGRATVIAAAAAGTQLGGMIHGDLAQEDLKALRKTGSY